MSLFFPLKWLVTGAGGSLESPAVRLITRGLAGPTESTELDPHGPRGWTQAVDGAPGAGQPTLHQAPNSPALRPVFRLWAPPWGWGGSGEPVYKAETVPTPRSAGACAGGSQSHRYPFPSPLRAL